MFSSEQGSAPKPPPPVVVLSLKIVPYSVSSSISLVGNLAEFMSNSPDSSVSTLSSDCLLSYSQPLLMVATVPSIVGSLTGIGLVSTAISNYPTTATKMS